MRAVEEYLSLDEFFDECAAHDYLADLDNPPAPPKAPSRGTLLRTFAPRRRRGR